MDSDDSDDTVDSDGGDGGNEWRVFVDDLEAQRVRTQSVSDHVEFEVGRNEMEKTVDLYFESDPDVVAAVRNEEMHSVMASSTPHWKERELLSVALTACSALNAKVSSLRHPKRECFEDLMVFAVESIFLFDFDASEIAAFLLLIEDAAKMNASFLRMLSNRNMSRHKRMAMMQIATKYFVLQSVRSIQTTDSGQQLLFEAVPSIENVPEIFSLSMLHDEDDGADGDTLDRKVTIEDIVRCDALRTVDDENAVKYMKRAAAYFQKWSKWNDR